MSWDTTGNAGTNPANDFLGTTDQQPLVLRTNGREDLRINPDGKVGIGTTDPGSKLEIVGDWADGALGALKLRGDKPSIKFAGGALAGNELWVIHLGSRGPGNLSFLKQAPGDPPSHFDFPMTLSSRVNPLDPAVEMVGDWNGNEGALRLSGDKPTIKFAGGAAAGGARWALHLGSRGPGNLEFLRETGPGAFDHVFTLSPTNRVGIGTSSPSATLEVAGDMKVTGGLTVNKIEFKTVVEQLNILRGDISHLSDNVSHLSTGPLTQQINSLQQQVSSLQAQVSSLQAKEASDVAGIANSLITLAARVTALGG